MNWSPLTSTVNIVFVDPTFAYLTLVIIGAGVLLMYLIVKSSDEFSVKETEESAEDFAGEIRDSKGPVTKWLWATYIALAVWAIAYLVQHWSEFATFP
jgi:hypothetical protein